MISAGRAPSPRGGASASAGAGAGAGPKRVASPVSPRRDLAAPGGAGLAAQQQRPPSSREGAARRVVAAAAGAAAGAAAAPSSSSLPLLDRDPGLRPYEGHLSYRWQRYLAAKADIAAAVEGARRNEASASAGGGGAGDQAAVGNGRPADSLAAFADSWRTWGLQRAPGRVTLREWIPGASAVALIGDFNGWRPRDGQDWARRDVFGVWSLELPDTGGGGDGKGGGGDGEGGGGGGGGAPALAHGSRYKLRVQSASGGWWADRVSAWSRYATAPQGQMGATYDGVAWWPADAQRHRWRHPRPPLLPADGDGAAAGGGGGAAAGGGGGGGGNGAPALRIYEAHVGMSGEREEVATYGYFAAEVLPRVKAGGYNAVQLMAVQVRGRGRGGGGGREAQVGRRAPAPRGPRPA